MKEKIKNAIHSAKFRLSSFLLQILLMEFVLWPNIDINGNPAPLWAKILICVFIIAWVNGIRQEGINEQESKQEQK